MAYVVVLSSQQILSTDAFAVTFAQKAMDWSAFVMPILVAFSAFGGLSVHIMTSSRMCFVGARNIHMPEILSHINVNRYTLMPSLLFLCFLSLLYLFISDVYVLITYSIIVESFFIMLSVSVVLYFRYTRPDINRQTNCDAVRHHLCVPDRRSVLRGPLRGRDGRPANSGRHSRLLYRSGVEEQTGRIRECPPRDDAVLPEDVHDGQRGKRRGGRLAD